MPSAEALKIEGNQAFAKQEFKKAAKIYRDAIKLDPTNPVLFSNRALCFIKEQDWNRALKDCNDGLLLKPDTKTKVKLLYRCAIVHKNLNDTVKAKELFEEVLKFDLQNTAASNELKNMHIPSNKKIRLQEDGAIPIPIQEVSRLPEKFEQLINPYTSRVAVEQEPSSSERLDKEIVELFGSKKKPSTKPQSSSIKISESHIEERSPMYMLASLKSLPDDQKIGAYKYILSLTPDYYYDVFDSTGIDSEFLAFFIEAVAYASSHHIFENWETKAYDLLHLFSNIRRYHLSLLFCSRDDINQILTQVNALGNTKLLQNYELLLSNT